MPHEGCQNWPLSYNSGMARPIVTKFGVRLETKQRCILHRSWVGYISTCARAHVQMYPIFCISETAGRIAVKFLCVARDLLHRRSTKV